MPRGLIIPRRENDGGGRRTYPTRNAGRADAFDCTEQLYNPKQRH